MLECYKDCLLLRNYFTVKLYLKIIMDEVQVVFKDPLFEFSAEKSSHSVNYLINIIFH